VDGVWRNEVGVPLETVAQAEVRERAEAEAKALAELETAVDEVLAEVGAEEVQRLERLEADAAVSEILARLGSPTADPYRLKWRIRGGGGDDEEEKQRKLRQSLVTLEGRLPALEERLARASAEEQQVLRELGSAEQTLAGAVATALNGRTAEAMLVQRLEALRDRYKGEVRRLERRRMVAKTDLETALRMRSALRERLGPEAEAVAVPVVDVAALALEGQLATTHQL
jgi:hypothetical protein